MSTALGKGESLDLIRDTLGEEVSGKYLRLSGTDENFLEKVDAYMREHSNPFTPRPGPYSSMHKPDAWLLRSNSSIEGQELGASFCGMFDTKTIHSIDDVTYAKEAIERALQVANETQEFPADYADYDRDVLGDEGLQLYASLRGVSLEGSEMNFILHKHESGEKVLVMEHPNFPDTYFMEVRNNFMREFYPSSSAIITKVQAESQSRQFIQYYEQLRDALGDTTTSFVLEGIESEQGPKVVQFTPALSKRDCMKKAQKLVGHFPDAGITYTDFTEDPEYPEIYTARRDDGSLAVFSAVMHMAHPRAREKVSLDMLYGEPVRSLHMARMSGTDFLHHAGMLSVENTSLFDMRAYRLLWVLSRNEQGRSDEYQPLSEIHSAHLDIGTNQYDEPEAIWNVEKKDGSHFTKSFSL